MGILTGKATIKVNGKVLNANPGATANIGGFTRTPQNGSTKFLGTFETLMNSEVNVTISVDEDTDLNELRNMRDVTLVFETDNGHRYLQKGGALQNPPVITGGDGGAVPLTFIGPPMEQL